jgi:sugar phosphate isomerase/epimerase
MINRRNFLKSTVVLTTGHLISRSLVSCENTNKTIGLQLYTVRDEIKTDLHSTLQKVAQIGYNSLEAAGYDIKHGTFYGMKPKSFADLVSGMGMKLNGTLTSFGLDMTEKVCEDAAKAGVKYIVYPYLSEQLRQKLDDYRNLAEQFNKQGEIAKKYGLSFGYHNHNFEFEKMEGEIPYDVLLSETDPSLVTYELDLYWIIRGGYDPVDYFRKYPGRFELWHLKDMAKTEDHFFAPVGKGEIDFKRIFAEKNTAGMKLFFVEQDRFRDMTPLDSITNSYKYLSSASFL